MKDPIHIILIEDNPSFREVIGFALKDEVDLELVDSFGAAEAALRSLQDGVCQPDVVLLDIQLPGLSGIEAIPQILEHCPDTKILMLTQSNREADVLEAIRLGAVGYLLKSSSVEEIIHGIHQVNADEAVLDQSVAMFLIKALHQRPPQQTPPIALTGREMEILTLMSEGLSKKMIADRLGIGSGTVGDHAKSIYQKLNVQSAPAAVTAAFREGILRLGSE
jgi:DNA-binding NarL/FixJ family response regulator